MKLLVIRRDNIGDLVLTTPVLRALRERFPGARLEAFVNSYNADVLEGHPDVDRVHVYTKAKHLVAGAAGNWAARARQVMQLRAERFDYAIVATPGWHPRQVRFARWLAPKHLVAFVPPAQPAPAIDLPVEYAGPEGRHHAEDTFRILGPLGIEGAMPAPRLARAMQPRAASEPMTIAIHVGARKPSSRWPLERFAQLVPALHARHGARFRLFGSPGSEGDSAHPGDDERVARLAALCRDVPVARVETSSVGSLVSELAHCQAIVCGDGGAMHIASALGLSVIAFFGDSDAVQWRPWGVAHRVLQPASREAADVSVEEVLAAFAQVAGQGARDEAPLPATAPC